MAPLKSNIRYREGTYVDTTTGLSHSHVVADKVDFLTISVSGNRKGMNPFEATHCTMTGSIMNGKLGAGDFFNCPAVFTANPPDYNAVSLGRANITALLAASNPSRPSMLLPVFWMELKDLPDMLRQAGRIAKRIYFERGSWSNLIRPGSVTRDTAAANLAIQFGWKPFVSDLWKIATLQDQVEKRRKELNALYTRGLTRRLSLGDGSLNVEGSAQVWSTLGIGTTVATKTFHSARAWGVARWKPNGNLPQWKPTDGELRRQLTGMSADAILLNLWEGLPWSWLVDWFIPVGQTIQAANRTVAIPVASCVMIERKTTISYGGRTVVQNVQRPWSISPGRKESTIHFRTIQSGIIPGVTASFPTLGANQLSILGSLAILRKR
jgi:hypothetical protein